MPAFQRLYSQYRDQGVAVVGIAVQDDPVVARQFIGDLGITYPTGGDLRNQSFQRFRVLGLPTTLSIGKDGKIIRRWDGELDEQRLGAMLRELVSAS
jgi:peroxiredoxin